MRMRVQRAQQEVQQGTLETMLDCRATRQPLVVTVRHTCPFLVCSTNVQVANATETVNQTPDTCGTRLFMGTVACTGTVCADGVN